MDRGTPRYLAAWGALALAGVATLPVHAQADYAPARAEVVYGLDDRLDIYAVTDPTLRGWADSVCGLFETDDLTELPGNTVRLRTAPYDIGVPPCPGEPFASQPTAAFCTGFVVGTDLIATAGHCFDNGDLDGVRFVFGWRMADADTPITEVPANAVYTPVELVGREQVRTAADYSIVRVDRPITQGAPLPIRRSGTIAEGRQVGVIGHPSGLPLKAAFSNTTVVRDSTRDGFFVANLDTYGGNSGSPVFDARTGVVEGILVRGATDFVIQGTCFESNTLLDAGGSGEDVTKTTAFAALVPSLVGDAATIHFAPGTLDCSGLSTVVVEDAGLDGVGPAAVQWTTAAGDRETATLTATGDPGVYRATIPTDSFAPTPNNGTLQVSPGETVTATYTDADDGTGAARTVSAEARVDCTPPAILDGPRAEEVGVTRAYLALTTDEVAEVEVALGFECGTPVSTRGTLPGTAHRLYWDGLLPGTSFTYTVRVTDVAGNTATFDNGGACYQFSTFGAIDRLTERFGTVPFDLSNRAYLFTPDSGPSGYTVCETPALTLPEPGPEAQALSLLDDSYVDIALDPAFTFFGVAYDRVFVGSNGYLTFAQGDDTFTESTTNHFALTRISPYFNDLRPTGTAGAANRVYYETLADRYRIRYYEVEPFDGPGSADFMAELFFDGRIRFAYGTVDLFDGLVGLSAGGGQPDDFVASDYTFYAACGSPPIEGAPEGEGTEPEGAAEGATEGAPEGEGGSDPVPEGEAECGGDPAPTRTHTADLDGSASINLSELLRVVQLYNVGAYACDATTEDGFAPGAGSTTCALHDADTTLPVFELSLSELLRVVQFFNTGGYTTAPCTEDGFAPRASPQT